MLNPSPAGLLCIANSPWHRAMLTAVDRPEDMFSGQGQTAPAHVPHRALALFGNNYSAMRCCGVVAVCKILPATYNSETVRDTHEVGQDRGRTEPIPHNK